MEIGRDLLQFEKGGYHRCCTYIQDPSAREWQTKEYKTKNGQEAKNYLK